MKKNRMFPYRYYGREVIGYCPRSKKPIYRYSNNLPRHKRFIRYYCKILLVFLFLCLIISLLSCSSSPIVDSRGKSSANINGDMNRYHDDYYTCESLVYDNTNIVLDKTKTVYNNLRWRILWLSPKLQTRQDLINNCLEGRGYNVLNK